MVKHSAIKSSRTVREETFQDLRLPIRGLIADLLNANPWR